MARPEDAAGVAHPFLVGGADALLQGVVAADFEGLGEVGAVRRPDLLDAPAPGGPIGLVPLGDVTLEEPIEIGRGVGHGTSLLERVAPRSQLRAGWSITSGVMGTPRAAAILRRMLRPRAPVGTLLREWRRRRRLSQEGLALDAEISPRHLSFVETGRAQPSRAMILHLSEELDVPLRDRNALLLAAGFAPMFPERRLDDAALAAPRRAIDLVLESQKPFPAFALDRHWNVAASNRALQELYEGVASDLLAPPVNALRLSLHPRGVAARVENLAEWRAHLLARLRRQIDLTADPVLEALLAEVSGFPGGEADAGAYDLEHAVLVPLKVRTSLGILSFFSTTTVFGTPVDVTLAELAIEQFFPADAATANAVRKAAAAATQPSPV